MRRKNRAAYSDSVIDADSSIALNLDYLTLLEITIEERTVPKRREPTLSNIVEMNGGEMRCAGISSGKAKGARSNPENPELPLSTLCNFEIAEL